VLVIGAHPDDEDTSLLSLLARGYGASAAYLALSRGEGGQNLIGDELGVDLGLLRSRELEAARVIDGAQQFFTRAYDFGYSRSLDETAGLWLPDSVLKDVVRVVRRFKPHVIVSVFTGTPRDGHGQHQMAGVMADRMFDAAGDVTVFPELQREEGLRPWTPLKLYRSARFNRAAATLELTTGSLDPRLGRTHNQVAMESRSQHRSQDMGRIQPAGPASTRLSLDRDRTGRPEGVAETDIFDGIEFPESWLNRLADSLRAAVSPSRMSAAVVPLAEALLRARVEEAEGTHIGMLEDAISVSAGLVVDARATTATVVPGQSFAASVELYNAGLHDVTVRSVTLSTPTGWGGRSEEISTGHLTPGDQLSAEFVVEPPLDARLTQPYFLDRPMAGALYDWSAAAPRIRGLPFGPVLVRARVDVTVAGAEIGLEREVTFRDNDQAIGELREALRVIPAIDVKLAPGRLVWSSEGDSAKSFHVALRSNAEGQRSGTVTVEVDGWSTPPAQNFRFTERGQSQRFSFHVSRPREAIEADVIVRAVAVTDDGRHFDQGVEFIQYGHIRPISRVTDAMAAVTLAPIRLPAVRLVGYVRGAADRVPEALAQVGLPLELLSAGELASDDLSRFDAIVVGSRAYETDSSLVSNNDRLLEYVHAGGRLIVQYQQYQFVRGDYAPYRLDISRPHDRITDENAPVTVLDPAHPVFTVPNRITPEDWLGWPQERGLYFGGTWDDAYTPLLEMKDPDRDPIRGGLLVADYGEGTYVYTGISFFRSLPAGVVGAYKLFLNLLESGGRGGR
jgi:LmbE family N-acetylglucosaminyl deacetylase